MLTFTSRRDPRTIDELDDVGREQLRISGVRWDGEDLPVEQRLFATDDPDLETNFYLKMLARWDVCDDEGKHAYDAWFFAVDSGVIFRVGTTDVVCVVVQFDFQSETGDNSLVAALAAAARLVKAV